MTFHPAVFNLTVVDPSLYPGLQGAQHPFFQQPQHHTQNQHLPNRIPGGVPGRIPNQYLEGGGHEDTNFQTFVHSLPSELQGPIAFRNDTRHAPFAKPRPIIPRLAIPAISNSTFVQLPVSTLSPCLPIIFSPMHVSQPHLQPCTPYCDFFPFYYIYIFCIFS